MRRLFTFAALLAAGCAAFVGAYIHLAQAKSSPAPPRQDWRTVDWAHLSDWIARLNRSTDPAAVALRKRIAKGPADLAREKEACRKEGIPLSVADLHLPKLPPEQNAAVDLKGKWDFWNGITDADGVLIDLMETRRTLFPKDAARMRALFDRQKPSWDRAERALAKPYFVVERKPGDTGADMVTPLFARARELAKFARDYATLLAIEGRHREAIPVLARVFRLSGGLERDPTLISYLVGAAVNAITVSGLQQVLQSAGPDTAIASDVLTALESAGPAAPFSQVVKHAIIDTFPSVEQIRKAGPLGIYGNVASDGSGAVAARLGKATAAEKRFAASIVDAAAATWLRGMRRFIAIADQPYPASHTAMARIQAEMSPGKDPVDLLLDTVFYGQMAAVQVNWTSEAASREVARAAAAVMAWSAKHGGFPERLEDAVTPATDPFTGKPLGYMQAPAGFVVFSRGPSGTFDGGKPGDRAPARTPVFRYPAPPVMSEAEYYKQRAQSEKEYRQKQEKDPVGGLGVQAVAASRDGRYLASALGGLFLPESTIGIGSPGRQAGARTIKLPLPIFMLAFSPDGKALACAGSKPDIRLLDPATGRPLRSIVASDAVKALAFSPAGTTLAVACADGQVTLWDWRTGRQLRRLKASPHYAFAATFSPDGRTIVTGGDYDGSIRIWNTRTGALLRTVRAHRNSVDGIAYSPDGRTFTTASWDGTAKLWDARRRTPIRTFTGHSSNVWSTCYSPNGRLLATVGGEVKVWDVAKGRLLLTKEVSADNVAFLADNRRLAVGIGTGVQIIAIPGAGRQ